MAEKIYCWAGKTGTSEKREGRKPMHKSPHADGQQTVEVCAELLLTYT